MAENRLLTTSLTQGEPLESGTTGVEPVVKSSGELNSSPARDRGVSESASLDLARPKDRVLGKPASTPRQKPPRDGDKYRHFRRLCDDILAEVNALEPLLSPANPSGEVPAQVPEIEALLERLYACPFGKGEFLKRIVVAIQSQTNNARWERRHVLFLRDVFRYLRVRYVLDEDTVQYCYATMNAHGLDPFRGTISVPEVVKRYRIQEVTDD